jgi:hypothetical protein
MTLVFAKECTLEGIREALEAKRTLAYSAGYICGDKQLLTDLFLASVKWEVVSVDKKKGTRTVRLTNMCSFKFQYKTSKNALPVDLLPFQTIQLNVAKDKDLKLTLTNMLCGNMVHPTSTLAVK